MAKSSKRAAWRKRPRQERAEATVEALLQAAAELLVAGGPERATTNDIARRAGASIGSLYQYFPNKEALFAELLRRHIAAQHAAFERSAAEAFARGPAVSVAEVAGAMIRGLLAVQAVNPELQAALIANQAQLDPEGLIAGLELQSEQVAAALLAQMADQTRVSDPELAGVVVVRAVVGVVTRTTERDAARLRDPALEAALVDLVTRYLVSAPDGAQQVQAEAPR